MLAFNTQEQTEHLYQLQNLLLGPLRQRLAKTFSNM